MIRRTGKGRGGAGDGEEEVRDEDGGQGFNGVEIKWWV